MHKISAPSEAMYKRILETACMESMCMDEKRHGNPKKTYYS